MARHLLYFQQVIIKLLKISTKKYFNLIKAGLTSLEVKFHVWEWEEELRKLNIKNVGLGNTSKIHLTISP